MDIIIPQTGSAPQTIPQGYQIRSVSDTLQDAEKVSIFADQVQAVVKKQIELENTIERYRELAEKSTKEFVNQSNRSIEVLGIFSSVIALLLLNIGVIAYSDTFIKAVILIIGMTCSISIFVILIHSFFGNSTKRLDVRFWVPFGILMILLIVAIFASVFDWKIFSNISARQLPVAPSQVVPKP
mgnify:CR=1 FL=1